ncbi:urea carboxylase-associated family protein [Solirubrobacter ginsenosidimutans]|uniref:Urea carboxylase-associated family protein n=1 Tax=Solirubrobacter ginsenosidimutans TaxID=490573 RepID=A0A9X3S347_9ACTN|nr:urea carboxylase-associated family protein [Solirubrobacter ginsenosidimutans]MDA0163067.1 urea carboxylase-associated family protein [Solirubrobacter ginsenosidimutans]
MALQRIPARTAVAVRVARGERVRVVNTHGQQVVDTWAFVDPAAEWMSMEHSRLHMGRVNPRVGDTFVTNRRRPVLTLIEDTSGGVHDTLLAACDIYRYELLGAAGHDNCTDNLHAALGELGLRAPLTPSPLNLFENAPPAADGTIVIAPPVSTPGSHVALRAELDLVIVFSACPQDMAATNGPGPRDAHFERLA